MTEYPSDKALQEQANLYIENEINATSKERMEADLNQAENKAGIIEDAKRQKEIQDRIDSIRANIEAEAEAEAEVEAEVEVEAEAEDEQL